MDDTSKNFSLSANHLATLFPFHFVVNRQFKLVQIGPGLNEHFDSSISLLSHVDEFFELNGPTGILNWSYLKNLKHNTCTLKHKKSLVNFSAKILADNNEYLIFIIKPLLSTDSYFNQLGLKTTDFIHHDVVNDLFLKRKNARSLSLSNESDLTEALASQTLQINEIRLLLANQEAESYKLTHIISRYKHWIIIADNNGKVEWANTAFTDEFALSNQSSEISNLNIILDISIDNFNSLKKQLITHHIFQKELLFNSNGVEKYIDLEVQALLDDANNILNIIAIGRDITDQKRTQAINTQLTTELNTIFDLSPDGFVSFNKSGYLRQFNTAFLGMTGISEAQLKDINSHEFEALIEKLNQNKDIANLNDTNTGSRILKFSRPKLTFIRQSIRKVDQLCKQSASVIHYFQDITHEYELSKMKGEFLSMAAHELRTPMASIYGFADLLLNREYSQAQTNEILQSIFRQANRMTSLINDLLNLARIESKNTLSLKTENILIKKLIDTTLIDFLPHCEGREIQIEDFDEKLMIKASFDQISQVLVNLLSNAHKYSTADKKIIINILNKEENHTNLIGIRVTDYGVGIIQDEQPKLFEPFFRSANTNDIPGTGLGLKIAKEIVELHGGKIEVESKSGVGTKVTFWISTI